MPIKNERTLNKCVMNLKTAKSEEQPDMRIQIGLSESGSLKQFTLPPGPEAYAFNLSIFARILDTSYSAADYYVGVVEVGRHVVFVLFAKNLMFSFNCSS